MERVLSFLLLLLHKVLKDVVCLHPLCQSLPSTFLSYLFVLWLATCSAVLPLCGISVVPGLFV